MGHKIKCPWGDHEVELSEYSKHLETCPDALKKAPTTLKELFKGSVLDGYLEAARVKALTEFVGKKQLKFTERVLGPDAAANLRNKKVVQTIRSDKEIEGLAERDVVEVTLDDKVIGEVVITSIDKVRLSELAQDDAERGGFSTLSDLQAAALRAGYRFKPLSEYVANRVLFTWRKEPLPIVEHKLEWGKSPRGLTALWSQITIDGKLKLRGHREFHPATRGELEKEVKEYIQSQIEEANPPTPFIVELPTPIKKILETIPADLIRSIWPPTAFETTAVAALEKLEKPIQEIRTTLENRVIHLLDLEGYALYLFGSFARTLASKDGFQPDSDIDVLVVPSLGKPTLTSDEQRKLETKLGSFILGHRIHVFSHPSTLEWKEAILLKKFGRPPELTQKKIFWHETEYFAYGSVARPLEWLTIRDSIKSVPYTALIRLSRGIDYAGDEDYFNVLLSPSALTSEEVKGLELTPLEKPPRPFPSRYGVREPKPLEKWYVLHAPHLAPPIYRFNYQFRGSWDLLDFTSLEELNKFVSVGQAEIYLHALRQKDLASWKPLFIPPLTLKAGEKKETEAGIWTLEQPIFEPDKGKWIWRVSVWDKKAYVSSEIERDEEEWKRMWAT